MPRNSVCLPYFRRTASLPDERALRDSRTRIPQEADLHRNHPWDPAQTDERPSMLEGRHFGPDPELRSGPALEIRPETPVSGRKNLVHVKLVYDDAGLATKPNRVCCNKKYGSRIREIQVTARKPFRARFGRSCGVDRACITGSLVFMAGFCLR